MPSARLLTKMINSRLNSFSSRLGVHCTQLDACLLYHSCWSFPSFVPIGWGWWEMPGHWQQRSFQFRIWRSSCNGEKTTYLVLIKTLWLCCSVPGLNVGKPETKMLRVFISVAMLQIPWEQACGYLLQTWRSGPPSNGMSWVQPIPPFFPSAWWVTICDEGKGASLPIKSSSLWKLHMHDSFGWFLCISCFWDLSGCLHSESAVR